MVNSWPAWIGTYPSVLHVLFPSSRPPYSLVPSPPRPRSSCYFASLSPIPLLQTDISVLASPFLLSHRQHTLNTLSSPPPLHTLSIKFQPMSTKRSQTYILVILHQTRPDLGTLGVERNSDRATVLGRSGARVVNDGLMVFVRTVRKVHADYTSLAMFLSSSACKRRFLCDCRHEVRVPVERA